MAIDSAFDLVEFGLGTINDAKPDQVLGIWLDLRVCLVIVKNPGEGFHGLGLH